MNTDFGSFLKEQRIENKYSLRELARKSNVSPGYLSQLENSDKQPSKEMVKKLAKALSAPTNQMLLLAGFTGDLEEVEQRVIRSIDEIMHYEIKEMQSQKYKELYDPAFKQETIEFLLNRYNFEGLSDIGIKQYTKEILDKYLDKVIYERKYKPHCNESAIDLVSDKLNTVLKEHLNNYFIDESVAENYFQHLGSDEIKNNLSYEVYTRISEIISTAQNEINDLRKSL